MPQRTTWHPPQQRLQCSDPPTSIHTTKSLLENPMPRLGLGQTVLWLNATWMGSKCRLAVKHSLPSPPLTSHPCVPASLPPPSERTLTVPVSCTSPPCSSNQGWMQTSCQSQRPVKKKKLAVSQLRVENEHQKGENKHQKDAWMLRTNTLSNIPVRLSKNREQEGTVSSKIRGFTSTFGPQGCSSRLRVLPDKHSLQRLQALCRRCLRPRDSTRPQRAQHQKPCQLPCPEHSDVGSAAASTTRKQTQVDQSMNRPLGQRAQHNNHAGCCRRCCLLHMGAGTRIHSTSQDECMCLCSEQNAHHQSTMLPQPSAGRNPYHSLSCCPRWPPVEG